MHQYITHSDLDQDNKLIKEDEIWLVRKPAEEKTADIDQAFLPPSKHAHFASKTVTIVKFKHDYVAIFMEAVDSSTRYMRSYVRHIFLVLVQPQPTSSRVAFCWDYFVPHPSFHQVRRYPWWISLRTSSVPSFIILRNIEGTSGLLLPALELTSFSARFSSFGSMVIVHRSLLLFVIRWQLSTALQSQLLTGLS